MNENEKKPLSPGETRRDFIKKASTAAAVVAATNIFKTPVYGQNQAPSPGRVIGANDRIQIAHIGIGGQGGAHVRSMKSNAAENNIAQVACCDVSKTRVAETKKYIESEGDKEPGRATKNVEGFEDHRKLLERKDIDAVVIATVDHWHTACSVDAMNAGKHVYVEKPMTRYLGEAFEIYDTVKKTGRILQVGSQGCSDAKWHKAAELIKAGKIGPLVLGQGSYMRNSPKGEWNYPIKEWATADDINWEKWLGPKIHNRVSFSADHYFRWRKYYPYCAGLLGDLFPHRLHPLMLATGAPEFPTRVVSLGSKKIHTDRNTPGTPERDVEESIQMIAEFPSGLNLVVMSSTISEYGIPDVIRGHHARLEMAGNRVQLIPERPFADDVEPATYDNLKPSEALPPHEKNWFDCIRENKEPNAGINLAVRVQTVISLCEMSDRLNMMCLFDEKTRKITNADGKVLKPLTYGDLPLS
jgi:predicted dehydrogenase